ncbi:MAG: amidohydrolase family protein [bacterium]|nr:amidohydrolase family protein [bacterium]
MYSIEQLLDEFEYYGVARGLVGSYRCLYQDVFEGNRETAAWAARFPNRLIPLAIVHPSHYGTSPETLFQWLQRDLGFRVVGLFSSPAYHLVDWDTFAVRLIGETAEKLGLVLQAGISTEAELSGLSKSWGNLKTPVLIRWMGGHRYKMLASEMAAVARHQNFIFDVGNVSSNGALEYLTQRVGAERLFFASNSPHNISACPHAIFREARLTPSQREFIGSQTLHKALKLDVLPAGICDPDVCNDWESLCTLPKVDVHWHPDHWNLGEPGLSEADQIATFNRFEYERVVMFTILALNYDLEAGNALTVEWFERDPRIFGMIVVNPVRQKASLEQLERYAAHPRFLGIKTIQDLFGIGLDDELYDPILTKAAELNLSVMAHMPGMDIAARRHPEITFVATHANWGRASRFVNLPNVYFDFSTGHALRHETQLARFVQTVGADRVLFGSDGQVVAPQWSLAKLQAASLSPEDKRLILRENAYRVFPGLKNCSG